MITPNTGRRISAPPRSKYGGALPCNAAIATPIRTPGRQVAAMTATRRASAGLRRKPGSVIGGSIGERQPSVGCASVLTPERHLDLPLEGTRPLRPGESRLEQR